MKKKFALILAMMLVLSLLAACGNQGTPYVPPENGAVAPNGSAGNNTTLPDNQQSEPAENEEEEPYFEFEVSATTEEKTVTSASGFVITAFPVSCSGASYVFEFSFTNPKLF